LTYLYDQIRDEVVPIVGGLEQRITALEQTVKPRIRVPSGRREC